MSFDQAIADKICELLADGEPLRVICRRHGMPAWRTVYDWKTENAEFDARFAHAREVGYDAIAEEALQIADTPLEGIETTTDDKGTSEKRGDMLGHRKLQIETRLKLLAKWSPKKYGDKLDLAVSGGIKVIQATELTSAEERDAAWKPPTP